MKPAWFHLLFMEREIVACRCTAGQKPLLFRKIRNCVKSVKKKCILYQLFMVFFCGFFMYNHKVKVLCHDYFCRNCTKPSWTKRHKEVEYERIW